MRFTTGWDMIGAGPTKPGLGDWWGRALWGLGTAAARSTAEWIRDEALGVRPRRDPAFVGPHAMAFAGLGAARDTASASRTTPPRRPSPGCRGHRRLAG